MPRIALGVAYDGSAFHGWQRQASVPTAQGALESALSQVAALPITTHAAGRTDAGVHATAQVVHFDCDAERPLRAWTLGVNALLPPTVQVRWARVVDTSFHARFGALNRRYQYLFADQPVARPLLYRQCWMTSPLAADRMHEAGQALLGEQDFSAFRAAGCQSSTPWRCVHRLTVSRHGPLIVLDVTANAFLLHMVRNMARALHDVGSGRLDRAALVQLLAGRDRTVLGATAPPQGLYLVQVGYPGPAAAAFPAGEPAPLLTPMGTLTEF
jgi:tRNA pseudouridine38-40 synthase